MMEIEELSEKNIGEATKLILELWDDCVFREEYENCQRILRSSRETIYLIRKERKYIAFIYLSLRTDHVEGASSSPVVYIEGIYVKPEFRRSGIAKKLVATGEKWGIKNGCSEYASDTTADNFESHEFHMKMGFKEAGRLTCYVKKLNN